MFFIAFDMPLHKHTIKYELTYMLCIIARKNVYRAWNLIVSLVLIIIMTSIQFLKIAS